MIEPLPLHLVPRSQPIPPGSIGALVAELDAGLVHGEVHNDRGDVVYYKRPRGADGTCPAVGIVSAREALRLIAAGAFDCRPGASTMYTVALWALREGELRVEIRVLPHNSIATGEDAGARASALAERRAAAMERGEREAVVYRRNADGTERISQRLLVMREQARALIAAGATWVGPDVYAP